MGKRKTGNAHNLIESLYISKKVGGEKKLQKKKREKKNHIGRSVVSDNASFSTILSVYRRQKERERKKKDWSLASKEL